jgi:hypothetical protein
MTKQVPVIKLNDPAHPERDNGDWIKALDDGSELALSGLPRSRSDKDSGPHGPLRRLTTEDHPRSPKAEDP